MKYCIIVFFLLLGITSCTSTYYIVRHAEKQDQSTNPALSSAGMQRATDLKNYFASNHIQLDSIYVSSYLRTQQTAEPTATFTGKTPVVINQQDAQILKTFIARLNAMNKKTILVIGHTTTVPKIVKELSAEDIGSIAENEFDNLYIITIKNGKRTVIKTTYGLPNH